MNKQIVKYLFWYVCWLWPIWCVAESAKLNYVHVATVKQDTQIFLTVTRPTQAQLFALPHPDRLVVDLKNTQLATSLKNVNLSTTAIKNIRVGYPSHDVTRMVFDLKAPQQFKILSPPHNPTLIISLHPTAKSSLKKNLTKTAPSLPVIVEKKSVPHPVVIAIDAGHGGHDPGAIGPNGEKEKNITLAIAKRLAYLINQHPRMRAILTRKGDYYVGLRGRLQIARQDNADLFIALHADSYFNNRASGASVYALSQHGATSEAARWLARRDNYSELGGVDLSELGDQSALLRSVLIDLAQTATITDSLHLGNMMLSNLKNVTRLHYSRVEQAPFMVLKSPDIPSILVEMGFISNAKEEARLSDENYQYQIALALFNSIESYLNKYSTGA